MYSAKISTLQNGGERIKKQIEYDTDFQITISRVEPNGTSTNKGTPMKLAAENNNMEIVEILRKAAGGEIPDDAKLQKLLRAMYEGGNRHYHHHHHHHLHHHHHQQLSKAMYEGDKEKFCDLLNSLSPDLVRLKNNLLKKKKTFAR